MILGAKKWDDKITPNFVPQYITYRTKDGKALHITLDKNTQCFKEWVAELVLDGKKCYVDRDELVAVLSKQSIKKEAAKYN